MSYLMNSIVRLTSEREIHCKVSFQILVIKKWYRCLLIFGLLSKSIPLCMTQEHFEKISGKPKGYKDLENREIN